MLKRYREIFFGFLFGIGAACIDMFTDAKMQDKPFWDVSVGMTLYRMLFVLFGCVLGWLLWRKNQRERQFRSLLADMKKLCSEIGPPTVMIHAQTQSLLAKPGLRLPPDAETMIRAIYQESQKLQSIARAYSGQRPMETIGQQSEIRL
jgi:hypothetical protein